MLTLGDAAVGQDDAAVADVPVWTLTLLIGSAPPPSRAR